MYYFVYRHIFRYKFFLLTLASALIFSTCYGDKSLLSFPDRPNVIIIIIDTLRADKMGCYGFPRDTSPELDHMAEKGVQFLHVIAQCSWTRPSIGSMITGIYPRTLGIYKEEGERLDNRFYTMAEMFKSNGYTTIGVTANPNINTAFGFYQGFDHYVDSNRIFPFMQPLPGKQMTTKGTMMSSQEVFETAFKLVKSSSKPPYYVQLNIMELHELGAPVRKEFEGFFRGEKNWRYLQALRQISYDISTFVKQITALPELGNTLFLITSDHGQGLDDHPGIWGAETHGFVLYESQLWVPIIMYHTRSTLGKLIRKVVRNMDLFPTVADILGMEIPDQIDGISLKPLIDSQDASVDLPDYFIAETYFKKVKKISVYSTKWKYFENRDNFWTNLNPRELQKMGVKERGKLTDQIEKQPEIAKKLGGYLEAWEKRHPMAKPTVFEMSEEEIENLRLLGYIE